MNEFRLSIELYGDVDNFGLFVISDEEQILDKLPTESFPIEDVSPEKIRNLIVSYLKKNCT